MPICPNCKAELTESINYKKKFNTKILTTDNFSYYKFYTFFCVNCGFDSVKEIKISKEDF